MKVNGNFCKMKFVKLKFIKLIYFIICLKCFKNSIDLIHKNITEIKFFKNTFYCILMSYLLDNIFLLNKH